jgi:hypothetical protein
MLEQQQQKQPAAAPAQPAVGGLHKGHADVAALLRNPPLTTAQQQVAHEKATADAQFEVDAAKAQTEAAKSLAEAQLAAQVAVAAASPVSAPPPAPAAIAGSPRAKRRKLDPRLELEGTVEQQLETLTSDEHRHRPVPAQQVPLRTLADSNFKKAYGTCGKPRHGRGIWMDPVQAVAQCFPLCFRSDQWAQALTATQGGSPLEHAGAACAYLWTAGWMFDLVQKVYHRAEQPSEPL